MPSTFLNLLKARPIAAQGKKERTSSQISEEARPSAFGEIWKRRVKWGHTISPIHFTQPSTQLLLEILVVFPLKPDTQLRVSPRFSSQTQPACPFPNSRIFPVRGNQLHPPRSTKINVPTAFAPRTHKLYHSPPPRVNRRVIRSTDKCGEFPKRGNKAPQRICRSNAVRRRNGERNGIVTSRICNILRCSAEISRKKLEKSAGQACRRI